jgi:NAD(P)-dependent dehydrogenase (short-subunit alcohol dehydrogenase family)
MFDRKGARMTNFLDRHVVITGGTGALGVAVVSALLDAGAICHVPYRSEAEAARLQRRDRSHLTLLALDDLTDEGAVNQFYAGLPKLWASIHLAGGFAFAPIGDTAKELLMAQMNNNFVSCFLCCRAAIGRMQQGKEGGRIVNVSARAGLEWRMGAKTSAYTASKAAVAALSVALAEEVAGQGILVNAVAPSIMDTPSNRKDMPKADHAKWPKVEEVANTILFLASPENRVTRGAVVPVYGQS